MIADHFWKILLILVVCVGMGWKLYDNSKKAARTAYLEDVAVMLDQPEVDYKDRHEEQVALYFQLIAHLRRLVEEDGEDIKLLLEEVMVTKNDPNHGAWFVRHIVGSLKTCDDLKIFENPENLLLMEGGEAPGISEGDFRKQKLVVGFHIHPGLAKEVRNNFYNFNLMPESVRTLQDDVITTKLLEAAGRMKEYGFIEDSTMESIRKRYNTQFRDIKVK